MSGNLGILLISIGGVAFMGALTYGFIKIMINTTKYVSRKNKWNIKTLNGVFLLSEQVLIIGMKNLAVMRV